MNKEALKKEALIDSLPVFAAYFPLGIVWGLLWEQAGLSPIWGPIYSLTVYAGTAQFLALAFYASSGSYLGLLAAAIPMALRYCFYTIAFLDRLPTGRWSRLYSTFALVDAPFAFMVSKPKEQTQNVWYTIPLLTLIHIYWVGGTAIGVWIGRYIPNEFEGLNFTLPALLAVLAFEQQKKMGSWKPIILAFLCGGSMWLTFGNGWLLPALVLCTLLTIFWKEETS